MYGKVTKGSTAEFTPGNYNAVYNGTPPSATGYSATSSFYRFVFVCAAF